MKTRLKRKDKGMAFIANVIFCNNRLKYYDMYIKMAKLNGYIIVPYYKYITEYKGSDKKILVLRHDVDNDFKKAEYMYEVEKKNNVTSTYYFRWSTLNVDFANKIYHDGFEVGLHYETLGTYCENMNIQNINDDVIIKCRKILKDEIREFKNETKINIQTIASHGYYKNIQLNTSNNVLVENQNYDDFGILSEAYDKEFNDLVTSHIMDTSIDFNYGFAYNDNPIESINNGEKLILFVAHPDHWKLTMIERIKLLVKFLLFRYKFSTSRKFKRIAYMGKILK